MVDVLLVQPPIRDFYLTAKRTIPYGLASIAASLRQAGFTAAIFDALSHPRTRHLRMPEEMAYLTPFYGRPDRSPFALFHRFRHYGSGFERIGAAARDSGAWLIGISALFTPYADTALQTAAAIRRRCPDAVIVMGGHHPTVFPESVMAHPDVDLLLRGDGEDALPALAQAVAQGAPLDTVPGIVVRGAGNRLHVSPPAVKADLDRLPLPAADLINGGHYRRAGGGTAAVVASRGCPLRCSYCSIGGADWLPYRRRSVSHVMAEIASAVAAGVRFIDFEDENLSMDRAWFRKLLGNIAALAGDTGLELRAMNGLFPPSLTRDLVADMRAAGFRTLNLALASASARQQARFNRPDVAEAFERALAWAEEFGLQAVGYVLVGAPFQSPETSLDDLLYLAGRRVLAGVSVFYPAPGSQDYARCRESGCLPADDTLMRASALPLDHTTDRVQTVTLLRLGRIVNFAKALIDAGAPLPAPSRPECRIPSTTDRRDVGIRLLSWFLYDGAIRGVTPDGSVYRHRIDASLTDAFRRGLRRFRLKGVTSG